MIIKENKSAIISVDLWLSRAPNFEITGYLIKVIDEAG